jgi:hypothetical protein
MKLMLAPCIAFFSSCALADYTPPYVQWNGWTMRSSAFAIDAYRQYQYPLTYLFDDDPKTTWTFSGKVFAVEPQGRTLVLDHWNGDYALSFEPEKPRKIDQIRIMNGYNKSTKSFGDNERIAEVAIYEMGVYPNKFIKRASLTDKMGWHSISIPRQNYTELGVVITKRYGGKCHDICVSGIELWNQGKKIDLHMPKIVKASEGDDCGCFTQESVMLTNGKRISQETEERRPFDFSPSGKSVAVIKNAWLKAFDTTTGKQILSRQIPSGSASPNWVDERSIRLENKKRTVIVTLPRDHPRHPQKRS